ncbi:hypothetical protein TrCOL_g13247 [Triparma columacea]|uniref:Uncharacterized protein n=1 Tax=Triparma columacea TaxID=722753 RepID=A0A9W7G5K6_9STRA|nr:hypothetical protein TrCOL_g13247 [Triparma columacea]
MKPKSTKKRSKQQTQSRTYSSSSSSSSSEPSPALNPMSCDFDSDSDALSVHALRDTIVSSLNQTSSKQQRFRGATSTYPRHASASRQRPPNPPDTANRSLARKVEEVKAQLLRERNKCDHLQSLLDQDASVSEENKKLRLQIKELQYNLKKQASEKSALESQTTSVNKRTKSSLNGMRAAIMTVEEVVKSRNQVSRREAAVNRDDDTMIEVLEEVEKRNRELGRELGKEKKEREERREENERMARLLSEYRLEIIRSKDAEERALHDLARERDTVDALRKRLDLAVEALRDAERSRLDPTTSSASHPHHTASSASHPPPPSVPVVSQDPSLPNPLQPPLPHPSMSPPRQSTSTTPTTSLSADEEMFTRLLQASNDKLLSDLREEVEKKLESVVVGETRVIEGNIND